MADRIKHLAWFFVFLVCVDAIWTPITSAPQRVTFEVPGPAPHYKMKKSEMELTSFQTDYLHPSFTARHTKSGKLASVSCSAPQYLFSYDMIGKIPFHISTLAALTMMSPDVTQAKQLLAQVTNSTVATTDPTGKHLLLYAEFVSTVALGVATAALALGVVNSKKIDLLSAQVGVLKQDREMMFGMIQAGNTARIEWQTMAENMFSQQQTQNALTQQQLDSQKTVQQQTVQNVQVLQQDVQGLTEGVAALHSSMVGGFAGVYNTMSTFRSDVIQNAQDMDEKYQQEFVRVYDTVLSLHNVDATAINSTSQEVAILASSLKQLYTIVYAMQTNTDTKRLLGQNVIRMIQTNVNPATEIAFATSDMVLPTPLDTQPLNARMEHTVYETDFVSTLTIGSNVYAVINVVNVTFFFNTLTGIDAIQPWSSIRDVLTFASSKNCTRPVVTSISGAIQPEVAGMNTNRTCDAWFEVQRSSCIAATPIQTTVKARDFVNQALMPSMCLGGAIQSDDPVVLRTFPDAFAYMQSNAICSAPMSPQNGQEYVLKAKYTGAGEYVVVPQNTGSCNDVLDVSMSSSTGSVTSLWFASIANANSRFIARAKEQAKVIFGRPPSRGVWYVDSTPQAVPSLVDKQTGGSAPSASVADSKVRIAMMNKISLATVPVYRIMLDTAQPVSLFCQLTGLSGNSPRPDEYDVESTATLNLQEYVPASFAFEPVYYSIGGIDSQYTVIWDAMKSMISISPDPRVRAGKYTYVLYPSDTIVSKDLDWFVANNGQIFNPEDMTDAEEAQVPKGITGDGFPYCSIPGGVPIYGSSSTVLPARNFTTTKTPDSEFCVLLSFARTAKISLSGQPKMVGMPYFWKITGTLGLGDGAFSTVVGQGCVKRDFVSTGPANLYLAFTNDDINYDYPQRINISTADPLDTFCNKVFDVTVPRQSRLEVPIPSCPLAAMTVSRLVTVSPDVWEECDTYTSGDFNRVITTPKKPDITTEIFVETQTDVIENKLLIGTRSMGELELDNLEIGAIAGGADQSLIDEIRAIKKDIRSRNSTYVFTETPGFNDTAGELIQRVKEAVTANHANDSDTNAKLNAIFVMLGNVSGTSWDNINSMAEGIPKMRNSTDSLRVIFNKTLTEWPTDVNSDPWSTALGFVAKGFEEVLKLPLQAAKLLLDTAKEIIDTALDLTKALIDESLGLIGSLGGTLTALMSMAGTLALIALVVYGLWWYFKIRPKQEEEKNKAGKVDKATRDRVHDMNRVLFAVYSVLTKEQQALVAKRSGTAFEKASPTSAGDEPGSINISEPEGRTSTDPSAPAASTQRSYISTDGMSDGEEESKETSSLIRLRPFDALGDRD